MGVLLQTRLFLEVSLELCHEGMCGVPEVQLHPFLTLVLLGGELLHHASAAFSVAKEHQVTTEYVGGFGDEMNFLPLLGIQL